VPETKKSELDDLEGLRKALDQERATNEKLREELRGLRKEEGEKKEKKIRARDAIDTLTDECNKLSKGFLYASLESIKLTADVTRTFIDKTYERNSPEKRDTVFKQVSALPWDMTEAFFDALEESARIPGKTLDKFYGE
jgi:predicted nuclease with TOPRIM domain